MPQSNHSNQQEHAFQHEVKFLLPDVLVECAGALGRQPPQPRAEILTAGALQKIRVGDFHKV